MLRSDFGVRGLVTALALGGLTPPSLTRFRAMSRQVATTKALTGQRTPKSFPFIDGPLEAA
jgi:hypothetical protein